MLTSARDHPQDRVDLAPLIAALQPIAANGNDLERCLVAKALGHIDCAQATALLTTLLRDDDPDVRADAAVALGDAGDTDAVAPLIANLRDDPVGENKTLYLRALTALGSEQTFDLLRALARGRGEEDGVVWEDDLSGWDDWFDVQTAAVEALGCMSPSEHVDAAIEAINDALADADAEALWPVASRALARLGDRGCDALCKLAAATTALNRKRIARAVDQAPADAAARVLLTCVKDADVCVRVAAIESAAKLGLESFRVIGLTDDRPQVRAATLQAFQSFDYRELSTALNDSHAEVRIAACSNIQRNRHSLPDHRLVSMVEKALRKASPEELAALIAAASVAHPLKSITVIEDVVNHRATDPKVRCACLRALGELNSANAVTLLAEAAADERRDVRLEAIVALSRIAKAQRGNAKAAIDILVSAIEGRLISAAPGTPTQDNNVVPFESQRGAERAREQQRAKIRIDRDGNIVQSEKHTPSASVRADGPAQTTTSTLDAMMESNVRKASAAERIQPDVTVADAHNLKQQPARRRIAPDASAPAHIDVRQLAARLAGDTGSEKLVRSLSHAAGSADSDLSVSAIESLRRLGADGIDINGAVHSLVNTAVSEDDRIKALSINALAWIALPVAAECIAHALQDASGAVRAAALGASRQRSDVPLNLDVVRQDEHREVRLACMDIAAALKSDEAVPVLTQLAFAENGVHKFDAARLLAQHAQAAVPTLVGRLADGDRYRRQVCLEMLPALLKSLAPSPSMNVVS